MKLVSIIIPVTRQDKFIKDNILALNQSTYRPFEVVVINEAKERSIQRNFGLDKAKGDYILYLDSDQRVTPELLQECVDLMKDYDALYIPEKIVTKGFFAYLRNWERQFYNGTAVDCVRFFKKTNERFDTEQHGPEDSDFDRRIPGKRTITRNHLLHDDNVSFLKFLKKKAYYSGSMLRFAERNPNDKVLNFWWRCFGVYIENGKWKRLVKRPDLTFCLFGLVFLRGVVYIWNR